MTRGVLIIATGTSSYQKLATMAAKSVVKHCPDMPVHIHSNNSEDGYQSRFSKLRMDEISPFDVTIALDADIIARCDISPLFDFVDAQNPIAMALDYGAKTVGEILSHRFFLTHVSRTLMRGLEQKCPEWTPHFNSGVIVFQKGEKVSNFFASWRKVWESREKSQDQLALVESCTLQGVFPSVLPQEWNYQHCITSTEAVLAINAPHVKILHLAGTKKQELYFRAKRLGWLQGI